MSSCIRHYTSEAKAAETSSLRSASAAYRTAEVHHLLGRICAKQLKGGGSDSDSGSGSVKGKVRGAAAKAATKLASTHFKTALDAYASAGAVASVSQLSRDRLAVTIDLVAIHLTGRVKATQLALRTIAAASSDIRLAVGGGGGGSSSAPNTGEDDGGSGGSSLRTGPQTDGEGSGAAGGDAGACGAVDDADDALMQLFSRVERQFSRALLDLIKAGSVSPPSTWTDATLKDVRGCYATLLRHVGNQTGHDGSAARAVNLASLLESMGNAPWTVSAPARV